jgi:hypothetical protein
VRLNLPNSETLIPKGHFMEVLKSGAPDDSIRERSNSFERKK